MSIEAFAREYSATIDTFNRDHKLWDEPAYAEPTPEQAAELDALLDEVKARHRD